MKQFYFVMLFISFFTFENNSFGQSLNNTNWTLYDVNGSVVSNWFFGSDTIYFGFPSLAFATYQTNNGVFTVSDFTGPCSITDTASYNYNILQDTLNFTLINDSCTTRTFAYLNFHFVRLLTSQPKYTASEAPPIVYPNPTKGQIKFSNLDLINLERIEIRNAIGQLELELSPLYMKETYSLDGASGMYFISFIYLDGTVVSKKIVKY